MDIIIAVSFAFSITFINPVAFAHLSTHSTFSSSFYFHRSSSILVQQTMMMPKLAPLFLLLLLLSFISGGTLTLANEQKTWCVAKPSSDQATLLGNINYACAHVDCQILQRGCPCFSPDNLINHASIAMNLYYQSKGRNHWNCDFRGSALTVITDPSYDNCIYA